jgi:hypothetical protein
LAGAMLPDFLDFGFELTFRGPCESAERRMRSCFVG